MKTTKPGTGTGMLSGATGSTNAISSTGRMKAPLAPPPGGGRIRSPLPPPPNDNKTIRSGSSPVSSGSSFASSLGSAHGSDKSWDSGRSSSDPFSDLSQLEVFHAHAPPKYNFAQMHSAILILGYQSCGADCASVIYVYFYCVAEATSSHHSFIWFLTYCCFQTGIYF